MIRGFKDLRIYQKSYDLSLRIHKLTKGFPKKEQYEMGSQIRRAAMSVPLNIAEGYGNKQSNIEFKRFLKIAMGSINEVEVLLDMSKDLNYINEGDHKEMVEEYVVVRKQIYTTIKKWEESDKKSDI